ncbi:MAG: GtrA family protein [Acidobacteriaceae bacterium]
MAHGSRSLTAAGLPREAGRFALIGAAGFGVDGGLLVGLHHEGLALLPARLLSFSVAVTVTWALNRRYTFPTRRGRALPEWRRYALVNGIGALLNLGGFFALLGRFPAWRATPLVPLALAAAVALVFNFWASRQIAFRGEGS